jgi:iron(III) transport system substrate-binding protein
VSRNVTLWRRALLAAVAIALLAVSGASASNSASAGAGPQAKAPKPATKKEWAALVAKAKQEGSVVVYTTQNPTTFANMAAKFKERYGIDVKINRNIDAVLASQVTAEFGSGKHTADIWIGASKPLVLGAIKNGWLVDAVGPNLFAKTYDRSTLAKPGKAFIVGTAVLGMGWNTNFFPPGLNDLPDLLNSRLKGRIGIPQPTSPSFVDWYLWVQETYGRNFLPRLAAQEPKIYGSSLPMTQAVASGEIAASPFVVATLLDLKSQGAPVGFKLAKGFKTWNAPFWGMMLKGAPHPAAAQLLADYMVTKEGMGLATRLSGSVIKGLPNTFYTTPRNQKLSDLTPKKVADFQAYWNSLFRD